MLNNFIAHIKVDGVLVIDKDDKAKAVYNFYDQLLAPPPPKSCIIASPRPLGHA
jgi:hypothetical protein